MQETQAAVESENTDENGIAAFLNISVSKVQKDRIGPQSIPFFRVGKAVRYNIPRVRETVVLGIASPRPRGRPRKAREGANGGS